MNPMITMNVRRTILDGVVALLSLAIAVSLIGPRVSASAQPPSFSLPPVDDGSVPAADSGQIESTKAKIAESLRGQRSADPDDGSLLGGVLEYLDAQGSLLDGSLLDAGMEGAGAKREETGPKQPTKSASNSPMPLRTAQDPQNERSGQGTQASEDARLAELLLRSARLLEQRRGPMLRFSGDLPSDRASAPDPEIDLIRALRRKAAEIIRPKQPAPVMRRLERR